MTNPDPLAPMFYAAVQQHLTTAPIQFYTQENLSRVIEADALDEDVFWIKGKALVRYDDIMKIMKTVLANNPPTPRTVH